MMLTIVLLAVAGFCISAYTFFVERKIKQTATYKPVCDISDRISCTKPMQSPYANLFYVSNATMGMLFYVGIGILAWLDMFTLVLVGAVVSALTSCFLAYLLYVKIKVLCLLCTSLYIINALMLVSAIRTVFF